MVLKKITKEHFFFQFQKFVVKIVTMEERETLAANQSLDDEIILGEC
jgi:hypothetical protein